MISSGQKINSYHLAVTREKKKKKKNRQLNTRKKEKKKYIYIYVRKIAEVEAFSKDVYKSFYDTKYLFNTKKWCFQRKIWNSSSA